MSNTKTSYSDLQNTARSILNGGSATEDGTVLLQQIEDFCSKLDRFVEEEKQCKSDLQEQVNFCFCRFSNAECIFDFCIGEYLIWLDRTLLYM